jgi:hypothetical protein
MYTNLYQISRKSSPSYVLISASKFLEKCKGYKKYKATQETIGLAHQRILPKFGFGYQTVISVKDLYPDWILQKVQTDIKCQMSLVVPKSTPS